MNTNLSIMRRNITALYGAALVVILVAVIAAYLILDHLRRESEERAASVTQNLTHAVLQTFDSLIDTIDVALLASNDEINRQMAAGKVDGDSINRILARQTERLRHVAFLRAMDERGDVVYGPDIPKPTVNNSDRDFFIRLREDPDAGLFVANPVFGRIAQKWIWPFARRIHKPDGSFGGVVVAAIHIDEIEKMLAQIKLEPGSVISVRDAELGLISRSTFDGPNPVLPGDKRLSTTFKEILKTNPREGTFISDKTTPDGVSRIYSYRRSGKYGFTVNVGLPREAMLAEWRYQTWVAAGAVGAIALLELSFSLLMGRAWRRQDQDVAALAESESRFRAIIEASPVACALYDSQLAMLYLNMSFMNDFGYTLDDIPTVTAWWPNAYPDPAYRQRVMTTWQARLDTARRENKPFEPMEVSIQCKDGGVRTVLVGAAAIGSWVDGLHLVTFSDITARKRLEQEREQYFKFFNLSTDAMAIADPFGCFKQVNPALVQMTGYCESELIAKPFMDFILLEDREKTVEEMKIQVALRPSMHFENRYVCKDGRVIVLSWTAYFDKSDGVTYATARDVTQLRQAEDSLERFFALVPDLLCIASTEGYFRKINPALQATLGYSEREILSTPYIEFVHPDDRTATDQAVAQQVAGKPVLNFVNRYRCKDGNYRYLEWRTTPAINKTLLYATARDISERREIEQRLGCLLADQVKMLEELRHSNAELEQFSYAISHDMRQPLRMIASYLQLLDVELAGQLDGEKREYFNFARDGAKRLDRMLVGLLEYSRVGRKGEPPAWLESRAVLDEALLFLRPAIAEAQAAVRIQGDWPRIFVSPDEILRLMQNLIGNAIKFRVAGRTPEITVTGEIVAKEWRMSVSDNGVGILPNQIGRLFHAFQRLQSRAAYEGTGIGLALCRKIAEHHGGRIWAESAGEGQGSRFCVVLPLTPEAA